MAFSWNLSATMNFPSASISPRLSCLIRWTAAKIYSHYNLPINVTRERGVLERCRRKLLAALNKRRPWKVLMDESHSGVDGKRSENIGLGWLAKRSKLEESCKHSFSLLAGSGRRSLKKSQLHAPLIRRPHSWQVSVDWLSQGRDSYWLSFSNKMCVLLNMSG